MHALAALTLGTGILGAQGSPEATSGSASWGPICHCFSEMSSLAAVLSFVASPLGRLGARLPVQLTAGRLCDVCPATWGALGCLGSVGCQL